MNKVTLLYFSAVLFFFTSLLMIGPRLPENKQREHSVYNVYLSRFFGFSLNGDSRDFIFFAVAPQKLLEKNNIRQDRPIYILTVSAIGKMFLFLNISDSMILNKISRKINVSNIYIYYYFVYIFVNIIFVFLSKFLFIFCVNRGGLTSYLGYLLVFNDVVKAFFWSPHVQLLNIVIPLFCLWCFVTSIKTNIFYNHKIFFLATLAGFGVATYASFSLFLPSVIVPVILVEKPFKAIATATRFLWRSLIVICLTGLPSLLWYLYVLHKTGSFYSHSTGVYHHVIWMKDAFQEGLFVLVAKLSNNLFQLFVFAAKQGWILLVVIVPFIMGRSEEKIQWLTIFQSPIVLGSIFISILFLVFFAMVGLLAERVAYSAIPPMIVFTAYLIQHLEQKSSSLAYRLLPIIIFSYGIYEVVKDGPYS